MSVMVCHWILQIFEDNASWSNFPGVPADIPYPQKNSTYELRITILLITSSVHTKSILTFQSWLSFSPGEYIPPSLYTLYPGQKGKQRWNLKIVFAPLFSSKKVFAPYFSKTYSLATPFFKSSLDYCYENHYVFIASSKQMNTHTWYTT